MSSSLLSDDVGYGDTGYYKTPSSPVPTPNIDSLAAQGMTFTDAHTPSSVCAPTRYSLMTGNYPYRGRDPWGVWEFQEISQILEGQRTVADVMRHAGYHTAFFGKWHMGGDFYKKSSGTFYRGGDAAQVDFTQPFENGPTDHGFDYSYVTPLGIQGQPYAYFESDLYVPIYPGQPDMIPVSKGPFNGGVILTNGHADPFWDSREVGPTLADNAVAFIDQHHQQNIDNGTDTPFFIYYSTPSIHVPITPPNTFGGIPVSGATGAGDLADMIFELDLEVGAIIQALTDRNLLKDTLIIFSSDNGAAEGEISGHDRTGGLRGKKATLYEGGHRVPFIARWGDGTLAGSSIPPGSVSSQLIAVQDWVATMYDLTNQVIPVDQAMDSSSLLPVLLGKQSENQPVRDYMVIQSAHWADPTVDHTRWRAIRQGDWALLFDENEIPEELYNLADDPGQTNNLIGDMQYDELLNELQTVFNYALYESDRTTDGDSIADSSDNCTLVQNNDQRDTDGDGYGNRCDPDFDNNGIVQAADLAYFKSKYFTTDEDADLDGNGIVQAADLAYFKSMFFSAPGPSCCAP
jgi:arylsulfatase A-like enzyme